jgi:hypothetical protein
MFAVLVAGGQFCSIIVPGIYGLCQNDRFLRVFLMAYNWQTMIRQKIIKVNNG